MQHQAETDVIKRFVIEDEIDKLEDDISKETSEKFVEHLCVP